MWIILWEVGGLAYLHWTTVRLFQLGAAPASVLAVAFAALWLVGSWRIRHMGVYASELGLRLRGLLLTRVVPWSSIELIHVQDTRGGKRVVLELSDGGTVKTSLWEQGIDFHGRSAQFRAVCGDLRARHRRALQDRTAAGEQA